MRDRIGSISYDKENYQILNFSYYFLTINKTLVVHGIILKNKIE